MQTTRTTSPSNAAPVKFAALRLPAFRVFVSTFMLTMMADNVEHVISYWVAWQKFHSNALGGFAVVSHWLPYLLFSVAVGSLNDRFDSRRLIQIGATLFACASIGWGYFFATDTLTIPAAMLLLVLHGCAGVFWMTSSQVLLYDIVGPDLLPSAIRLNATARYLGVLVGPGVGSVMLRYLGPTRGIFLNACFFVPLLVWLIRAPYGRHFRGDAPPPKRAVRGLGDIIATARDVRKIPVLVSMTVLAGAASFFIGNSYQAQMPSFATDLGHANPGVAYTSLLGADAAGALLAGILLESGRKLAETKTSAALVLAACWGASLGAFALTRTYPVALTVLFCAGFFELSFSSMTQTIVQINAPNEMRGRVLGLFNMSSAGLRTFSGVTVGLLGSVIGIHTSLAAAATVFIATALFLLLRLRSATPNASVPS